MKMVVSIDIAASDAELREALGDANGETLEGAVSTEEALKEYLSQTLLSNRDYDSIPVEMSITFE